MIRRKCISDKFGQEGRTEKGKMLWNVKEGL